MFREFINNDQRATTTLLSVGIESCSLKNFSDTKFVYHKIAELDLVFVGTNTVTHLLKGFAFSRLVHQNQSYWLQFWLCLIDIHFFYYLRHTEWIPPTSHQVTNLNVCLMCSSFCSFKVLNWTPAFVHFEPTRWNLLFNICAPFPILKQIKLKVFTYIIKCFDTNEVSAILQALHMCTLLSRSSREMKFDSSLWYVKASLLRFC